MRTHSPRVRRCLQGRTYAPGGVKDELADAIREFNDFVVKDERVEVVAMPFRDGVSIVQRRCACAGASSGRSLIHGALGMRACASHQLHSSWLQSRQSGPACKWCCFPLARVEGTKVPSNSAICCSVVPPGGAHAEQA